MKLSKLLQKNKWYYINSYITDKNFPEQPFQEDASKMKLVRMEKSFTSQEALERIKEEGGRPATIHELAYHAEYILSSLKNYEFAIGFGSQWIDADGNHRVPCVLRSSFGDDEFNLGVSEYDWSSDLVLVLFCNSDTQPISKKSEPLTLTEAIKVVKEAVYRISNEIK